MLPLNPSSGAHVLLPVEFHAGHTAIYPGRFADNASLLIWRYLIVPPGQMHGKEAHFPALCFMTKLFVNL